MRKFLLLGFLIALQSAYSNPDPTVCDSLGMNLPQAAPGTTVTLDARVLVDIYWDARSGTMKNELLQFVPLKPKDLFGHSNILQSKWWPFISDYQMQSLPADFICWVYVELRTVGSGVSYSLAGYLDENGKVRGMNGNLFTVTVAPARNYYLIVHAFNGNTIVAANNGTTLKEFAVTTADTLSWDFTDDWRKALIHNTFTSYPMFELPGLNGETVWTIPSGDVPESFVTAGDRISSWDNFIDLSDLRLIEINFGLKQGFSPYDLNLDKQVTVDDWLYVHSNTLFMISGNPFVYNHRYD